MLNWRLSLLNPATVLRRAVLAAQQDVMASAKARKRSNRTAVAVMAGAGLGVAVS